MRSRHSSRKLNSSSESVKRGRSGSSRMSPRWRARIGKHAGMRCVFSRNILIMSREWRWLVLTNGRKWWRSSSLEPPFFKPRPAISQLRRSFLPGNGYDRVKMRIGSRCALCMKVRAYSRITFLSTRICSRHGSARALRRPAARLRSRASGFGTLRFVVAFELIETVESAQHRKSDKGDKHRPIILIEELHDAPTVVVPEICKDREPNAPPHGQSGQKLSGGILHSACGQQHGYDGKRRGQYCGYRDGCETPAFKNRVDLVNLFGRESLLESLFATFASHAIRKVAAEEGSRRCHDRVVEP